MGVFCDRLKLGSTAALDCWTGQNKNSFYSYSSCWMGASYNTSFTASWGLPVGFMWALGITSLTSSTVLNVLCTYNLVEQVHSYSQFFPKSLLNHKFLPAVICITKKRP